MFERFTPDAPGIRADRVGCRFPVPEQLVLAELSPGDGDSGRRAG